MLIKPIRNYYIMTASHYKFRIRLKIVSSMDSQARTNKVKRHHSYKNLEELILFSINN